MQSNNANQTDSSHSIDSTQLLQIVENLSPEKVEELKRLVIMMTFFSNNNNITATSFPTVLVQEITSYNGTSSHDPQLSSSSTVHQIADAPPNNIHLSLYNSNNNIELTTNQHNNNELITNSCALLTIEETVLEESTSFASSSSPAMFSTCSTTSSRGDENNSSGSSGRTRRNLSSTKITKKKQKERNNNLMMNSMLHTMTITTFCNDTPESIRDKCNLVGKRGVGRPKRRD